MLLTTVNSATSTPSIVTLVVAFKFTPVIVISVPPNTDPETGETSVIVGIGRKGGMIYYGLMSTLPPGSIISLADPLELIYTLPLLFTVYVPVTSCKKFPLVTT